MPVIRIPDSDCKLAVFPSGTVAFAATPEGGKCLSTRTTSLHNVWTWYETALDIASLPTTTTPNANRQNARY